MRPWVLLLTALALAALLAVGWAWRDYQAFLARPLAVDADSLVVNVQRGDNARSVISRLAARGITRDSWHWRVLLRREPATIRAGEFQLQPPTLPRDLLRKLASNDVVQYRFTLIEGWTYRQLADALVEAPNLTPLSGEVLDPQRVMAAIGSDMTGPEGWFLPETYAYVRGDSPLDILRRAHLAMRTALAAAWAGRDDDLPLENEYQLLTLASIVEKEAGIAAEQPQVAGVFVRRLQQRWRLETDPTVIYGLGEAFDGNLRRADLRADTPYNTYTRHGLPPTPIAMPGAGALRASASPAAGSAMFFVADGEGGHVFSDTLQAHNQAVRALVKKQTGRN